MELYNFADEISGQVILSRALSIRYDNGVIDETDYRQDYPYHGKVKERRKFNAGRKLMQRSIYTYDRVAPFSGTELIRDRSEATKHYHNGTLLFASSRNLSYDSYGNIVRIDDVRGDTMTTETVYAPDMINWILQRPGEIVRKRDGVVYDKIRMDYSGGNLRSLSRQILPSGGWSVHSYEYDSYGNVTVQIDPLGARTSIEYETALNKYTSKITDALGFAVLKAYDTTLGKEIRSVDPNGAVTQKSYDAYGRLVSVKNPGEKGPWSVRMVYNDSRDSSTQYIETQQRDGSAGDGYIWSREYKDGLGRTYRKEKEGYKDATGGGQRNLLEVFDYDDRGRLYRYSKPYFAGVQTPPYFVQAYADPDGLLTRLRDPDGSWKSLSYSGLTITQTDQRGRTYRMTNNARGKVISRTASLGEKYTYTYATNGKLITITDPGGSKTTTTYNSLGGILKMNRPDSGTVSYVYNAAGRITKKTDARGVSVSYTYDVLGRLTLQDRPGAGRDVRYYYDEGTAGNGLGRLTSVRDEIGSTQFGYDARGNITATIRKFDQYTITFRAEYDSMNRKTAIIYPDGSRADRRFSGAGHLAQVELDGHPVISYRFDATQNQLQRITGNNVSSSISFDPNNNRPLAVETKLADGSIAQKLSYSYDSSGNILRIRDRVYEARSQTFEYDALNRVIRAKGLYGDLKYAYNARGNLRQKGAYDLSYVPGAHPHAVAAMDGPGGRVTYNYDRNGNMVRRNGQARYERQFEYDAENKMTRVSLVNGGTLYVYVYDYTGSRVKKVRLKDGWTRYSAENLYEISTTGGQGDAHTLYIRGIKDELVAQLTKKNVSLSAATPAYKAAALAIYGPEFAAGSAGAFLAAVAGNIPGGVAILAQAKATFESVHEFYSDVFLPRLQRTDPVIVCAATLAIFLLYLYFYVLIRDRTDAEFVMRRPGMAGIAQLMVPVILIVFTGCGIFDRKGKGQPPWIGLPPGIDQNTPSIGDVPGAPGNESRGFPVSGMYFFHPNHIGSIRFLTDDKGRVVTGNDNLIGRTEVIYKPYGEILKQKSGGPDIFHFKYTQQEQDPETGLYYYKERFYDPKTGCFLSPDSYNFPGDSMGMNPYAYVKGNPLKYSDPTGNISLATVGIIIAAVVVGVWALDRIVGGLSLNNTVRGYNWMGNGNKDGLRKKLNAIVFTLYGMDRYGDELDFNRNPFIIFVLPEKQKWLWFIKPPKPTSVLDRISFKHDRAVPKTNFTGCSNARCRANLVDANKEFINSYSKSLSTGEIFRQPLTKALSDFVSGAIGSVIFALDNLYQNISYPQDSKRNEDREFWAGQKDVFIENFQTNAVRAFVNRQPFNIENYWQNAMQRATDDYITYRVSNWVYDLTH